MLITTTIIHCLYSFSFEFYVKAESSRFANEELLNNLEEGVLIIEEDCSSVLFMNTAAQRLISNPSFDKSLPSDLHAPSDTLIFNWDQEMFAEMDKEVFTHNYNVDATSATQYISSLKDY